MRMPKPNYANVTSTLALLLAASGTAYAATLPNNSVGTPHLQNGAVTAPKIAANAVGTGKVASGAVTSAKIANATIKNADLAPEVNQARDAAIAAIAPVAYSGGEGTIQSIGASNETGDNNPKNVGNLAVPPGRYYVHATLRSFASGDVGLYCGIDGDGASGIVNVRVDDGVAQIPIVGIINNFDGVLDIQCQRSPGANNITVSWRMVAVAVQ